MRAKPRGFNDIRPFIVPVSVVGPSSRTVRFGFVLPSDVAELLWSEAQERQVKPCDLATDVLSLVLRDGLVAAVLDK